MDTLIEAVVDDVAVDLPMGSSPPRRPWRDTTGWTPPRILRLKELYGTGVSFGVIAKDLGGITRNAVIGKVHRLGLPLRGKPLHGDGVNTGPRRARNPDRPRAARKNPLKLPPSDGPVAPISAEDQSVIPLGQRKTILDIENHHCHFPYGIPGEASFFYCGAGGVDMFAGRPYCPGHAKICFNGRPEIKQRPFNSVGMPGVAR